MIASSFRAKNSSGASRAHPEPDMKNKFLAKIAAWWFKRKTKKASKKAGKLIGK
jgi:hypothetical protein